MRWRASPPDDVGAQAATAAADRRRLSAIVNARSRALSNAVRDLQRALAAIDAGTPPVTPGPDAAAALDRIRDLYATRRQQVAREPRTIRGRAMTLAAFDNVDDALAQASDVFGAPLTDPAAQVQEVLDLITTAAAALRSAQERLS